MTELMLVNSHSVWPVTSNRRSSSAVGLPFGIVERGGCCMEVDRGANVVALLVVVDVGRSEVECFFGCLVFGRVVRSVFVLSQPQSLWSHAVDSSVVVIMVVVMPVVDLWPCILGWCFVGGRVGFGWGLAPGWLPQCDVLEVGCSVVDVLSSAVVVVMCFGSGASG